MRFSLLFLTGLVGLGSAQAQEIQPVSYTHLDVYKRQYGSSGDSGANGRTDQ